MRDFYAAQLRAQQIEEQTGLSLAEQATMPLDEWARLAYGQTPAEAALHALGYDEPQAPGAPHQEAPAPVQEPQQPPQGIDPNSDEYFLAWRANRHNGGEGRGIFDSVGSRSDAYTSAVRAHAGRTALSNATVEEAPRLEGRYLNHDERIDTRSARDRFSTPGNAFNL